MPYLTIEYDKNLEITRVTMPDGEKILKGKPLKDNPIGPGEVNMITVSEIVEWTDPAGMSMI
jgi:hypothetical protein